MPDKKISELTATTSLDAADEFPLNDSGTTKKITAANLAAQLSGFLPQEGGGGGGSGSGGAGPTGATGPTGPAGPAGLDGTDGQSGAKGATGATGPAGGGGGLFDAYAYLRDEQTSGTQGGGATSGSWQTRVLNTVVSEVGIDITLTSNQFDLAAGTYWFKGQAPFRQVAACKIKLRNISDSTDDLIGTSGWADTSADNPLTFSFLTGRVTIASTKTFELQYRVGSSKTTDGLGVANSFSVVEIYAELEIWREA